MRDTDTPRSSGRRRLIAAILVCAFLGILTTVALAWWSVMLPPQGWPASLARGLAVVDGRIVSIGVGRRDLFDFENWEIRDPEDGGFDARSARKRAARIQEIGGEAYDREVYSLVQQLSIQPVSPLPKARRIDDRAALGVPREVLDGSLDQGGTMVGIYRYGWPLRALTLSTRLSFDEPTQDAQGRPTAGRSRFSVRGALKLPGDQGKANSGAGTLLPYRPLLLGLVGDITLYSAAWSFFLFGPRWFRRFRRLCHGLCLSCGYDLRGAPTATCPECGTEAHHDHT